MSGSVWLYPVERRHLWSRRRRAAIFVLAFYIVLALLDRAAYRWWHVEGTDLAALEGRDWYRVFRVLGSILTWALVGGMLALAAGGRGLDRGLRMLTAAATAGLLAEILKFPVGRLRPSQAGGNYQYLGLWERFTDQAHGGPSSHAAVAFGGLGLIALAWPRTAPLALAAACGCAATRVVSGAHFLTDVYMGAILGLACAWLLRPRSAGAGRRVLLP